MSQQILDSLLPCYLRPREVRLVSFLDGSVLKPTETKKLYVVNGKQYGYGTDPVILIVDTVIPEGSKDPVQRTMLCPWHTVDSVHL